jgi:hypothetical protein
MTSTLVLFSLLAIGRALVASTFENIAKRWKLRQKADLRFSHLLKQATFAHLAGRLREVCAGPHTAISLEPAGAEVELPSVGEMIRHLFKIQEKRSHIYNFMQR